MSLEDETLPHASQEPGKEKGKLDDGTSLSAVIPPDLLPALTPEVLEILNRDAALLEGLQGMGITDPAELTRIILDWDKTKDPGKSSLPG